VLINALGHPRLCWQAGGNGSAVTLERCDPAVQGQQWSLTGDGVVMNGNGYCLDAGTGVSLFIDFAGQCAGAGPAGRGQIWRYRAGQLASAGSGTCAGPGGPVAPGTEIVRRPCPARSRWSIGYSAVTVAPGPGSGPAGGTFGASVTVANAASAQTAYGVAVTFALPPQLAAAGLRVTALRVTAPHVTAPHVTAPHVTGAAPGLSCHVRTLTCTGTLPSGTSARIAVTGLLPVTAHPGTSCTIRAHASVTGTSQRPGTSQPPSTSQRPSTSQPLGTSRPPSTSQPPGTFQRSRSPGTSRTTAALTIVVHPAAAPPAAARSPLLLIAAVAATLLLAGALLILITCRSRSPAKHTLPH